jgi:hypothetical protein
LIRATIRLVDIVDRGEEHLIRCGRGSAGGEDQQDRERAEDLPRRHAVHQATGLPPFFVSDRGGRDARLPGVVLRRPLSGHRRTS